MVLSWLWSSSGMGSGLVLRGCGVFLGEFWVVMGCSGMALGFPGWFWDGSERF